MPIPYKARKAIFANKEGKKLYHPQVVIIGNTDLNDLSKEVAELSSLSTGDVKNTIDNLIIVMTRHLQSGESVTLDGLGSFTLSLKSRGKGAETPEEVSPSDARLKINFRPTSTRNSDRTVATRSLMTGSTFVRWGEKKNQSTTDTGSSDPDTGDVDNGDNGGATGGNPL
ncbi:MAG: HU family DNA-binding protein [Bacteroidaceae bacterium]|nr:HU family DNA-binding protein [Bacteroidaceae bacterium]